MLTQTVIENVLILLAESFWVFSTFSQLVKLARTKDPKGLFAPTLVLNIAGNFAWITYFSSLGKIVPIFSNVIMATLLVITISYLLTNRKQLIKAIFSIVIIAPLVALLIIRYPSFSGWTGMIFNTISATPWLYHIITTKKTSGLSEKSLYFSLSAITCNLIYAIMIGSAPVLVSGLRGALYTLIIISYYYRYRGRARTPKTSPKHAQ
jgi:uncharacterized protein with PQ loop repeat